MTFQTPIASIYVYTGSFFPHTIRDWNVLPDALTSTADVAEDCVGKFTSLVRVRDKFPPVTGPGEWFHFDVSPVNCSDSDITF